MIHRASIVIMQVQVPNISIIRPTMIKPMTFKIKKTYFLDLFIYLFFFEFVNFKVIKAMAMPLRMVITTVTKESPIIDVVYRTSSVIMQVQVPKISIIRSAMIEPMTFKITIFFLSLSISKSSGQRPCHYGRPLPPLLYLLYFLFI